MKKTYHCYCSRFTPRSRCRFSLTYRYTPHGKVYDIFDVDCNKVYVTVNDFAAACICLAALNADYGKQHDDDDDDIDYALAP